MDGRPGPIGPLWRQLGDLLFEVVGHSRRCSSHPRTVSWLLCGMSAPAPTVGSELKTLLRALKLGRCLDSMPERLALASSTLAGAAAGPSGLGLRPRCDVSAMPESPRSGFGQPG